MAFTTKLDFSSNRQVKQHEKTITSLSGGTSFGLTFTAMTSGPDLSTSSVTQTITSITSTFSGNSGTTNYTWYDGVMSLGESTLSALTPSISGITQITGPVFTSDTTTIIDNNNIVLSYSGVDYTVTVTAMDDLGGGSYSGTISTAILNILSANTLDYTGRTIWNDVSGITRTERLIITETPNVGYVWTCNNIEGMGEWAPSSGSPSTSIWTGGAGTYSAVLAGSGGVASNTNSVSEGRNTTASGYASHAEGMGTIASGNYSHAEGMSDSFGPTIASGYASHAEGSSTRASGQASHAEGYGTTASGNSSHAGGAYSQVDSDYGFIHAYNSRIYLGSQYSAILGGNNNIINTSENSGVFVGRNNIITGTSTIQYSVIVGGSYNTIDDNSDNSVIIGGSNNTITNSANYSVVLGGQNITATTSDTVYVPNMEVNGSLKVNDGTQQDGYVFTSDANGVGSWQENPLGAFMAVKQPEAIVIHSLTAKGIPDGQVITGYTSIFYNDTDISGTLTTPFGTFNNTTGLFTTNIDCVLNLEAWLHLKADTTSTNAWETGATPTQIGLGICPNNTTDISVGDFLTILPSVSRGLDLTTGITFRALSGSSFRVKILNQTSRAYLGSGFVSGDVIRFNIKRIA